MKCYRPLERPVRMDEAPAVDAGFWIGLRNVAIGLLILWLFGMLLALWITE